MVKPTDVLLVPADAAVSAAVRYYIFLSCYIKMSCLSRSAIMLGFSVLDVLLLPSIAVEYTALIQLVIGTINLRLYGIHGIWTLLPYTTIGNT